MAYIYQKQLQGAVSGYDQCLILNAKESILYPLPNELKDWKELRIGFNFTLTSGESPNATGFTFPAPSQSNTSYSDSYYFGLKTNNNLLPFQNGCAFIGLGHKTGINTTMGNYNSNSPVDLYENSIPTLSFLMGSGEEYKNYIYKYSTTYNNTNNSDGSVFTSVNNMFESGAPFAPIAIKLVKQGNSIRMLQCRSTSNLVSLNTNDNSITGLRNFMNMFGIDNSKRFYPQTNFDDVYFPFTNDMTSGGYPVPIPDALFIYWSHPNTKLRVHNFCVEKYA